jgi:hypothetical protein
MIVSKVMPVAATSGFESALMFRSRLLGPRLFRVFDADSDGRINFTEFVACLSSMSTKATPEEKLKRRSLIHILIICVSHCNGCLGAIVPVH